MKIAFYTLGCKVNQYETENLKGRFAAEGFELVEDTDQADVYVINSCTVTASGDKKTRQVLHRFRRQNPDAVLALTGCMPQAFPEKAEHLPEAQIITGRVWWNMSVGHWQQGSVLSTLPRTAPGKDLNP